MVAPLDWGLGHATRCFPIIRGLFNRDCEVLIASSGSALKLLKSEFPILKAFELSGYNPVYPTGNGSMVLKMGVQLPHFIQTINNEHDEVQAIIENEKIDVVISDNRYGCHSTKAKTIFVYHQIHLLMPRSWNWMEPIVNHFNNTQIERFNECWIPANDDTLFPDLFRGMEMFDSKFIGYLSRFKKEELPNEYDVTAVASGPSPQREIFIGQMEELFGSKSEQKCFLVRGEIDGDSVTNSIGNYTTANYLNSDSLNTLINKSRLIIARSGYSTVMDLMATGKQALFIPTPGQTEQEYVGQQLMDKGITLCCNQNETLNFSVLNEALEKYKGFEKEVRNENLLDKALDSLL